MAVFACPSCGRPTTIPLHEPRHYRCLACGASGQTPEELAQRLDEAGRWLFSMDRRSRRVATDHRQAINNLRLVTIVYVVLSVVPTFLLGVWALAGFVTTLKYKDPKYWSLGLSVPPVILFVAMVALVTRALVLRRRKLENERAAVPPAPGGKPECRICGGELPDAVGAYAECRYCGADNLVDRKVMARVGADKLTSLAEFDVRLKKAVSELTHATAVSVVGSVAAAVALPFVSIVVCGIVVLIVAQIGGETHEPKRPIALVPYGNAVCIADMRELEDGRFVVNAGKLPDGQKADKPQAKGTFNTVVEDELKRKALTLHGCPATGKKPKEPDLSVTALRVTDWLGDLRVEVRRPNGSSTHWYTGLGCGLCYPAK